MGTVLFLSREKVNIAFFLFVRFLPLYYLHYLTLGSRWDITNFSAPVFGMISVSKMSVNEIRMK